MAAPDPITAAEPRVAPGKSVPDTSPASPMTAPVVIGRAVGP